MGSAVLSTAHRASIHGCWVLGILVIGLLLPSPCLGQRKAPPEPLITAIELRSDASAETRKELQSMIAITPGEPLQEAAVRRTLRNLHATGLVASAEVYTRPAEPLAEESGTIAVVVARAAIRIEGVALAGDLGLAKDRLLREVVVTPGQTLAEDRLLRSVYNLQDLYAHTGYPAAQVRLAVEVHRDRA